MPRVNVRGCELYYEDSQAKGEAVVFVHGVWMSSRFFRHQQLALGTRYRVVIPDMRGHGRSSQVPVGHTVPTYARDLHDLIEALQLGGVVLVGWSMGCMVIWDYLLQFGAQNVRAIVLIDQSPCDFKSDDWPFGAFDLASITAIMNQVQTDRDGFVNDLISLMAADVPTEATRQWMFDEVTRPSEAIASAILFDQTMRDYRPMLEHITVPSLVVCGGKDKLIPVAASEHMAHQIPGAKHLVFDNSGHCPFLDEPERFNEEIDQFIQSLP
ncbi:alpha/beta fold hydrolase [Chondromyces apiculatus]|uniref:Alpha/beta hydrolase n=1 Tax=Chondromyces apiculatus DSM 436 TaxID=1192034 RepID=A0A017TC31_9BACT|nr:alpha/beta hydrolase [Chondromyces apiculatus]EYF06370.1 alpha/beta hydrolase [Chondromyces apiculatus DSM 436]